MARNGLSEVLNFESTFEARGEEATKGRNEGGECGEDKDVKLHRSDVNGRRELERGWERKIDKEGGGVIGLMYEHGVWVAGEAREYVGAKVLKDD